MLPGHYFPISGAYQGTGMIRLTYVIDTARECVFPIFTAWILGTMFGLGGVEASFIVAGVLVPVLCIIIPWVKNHKFPRSVEGFLILPADFGAKKEDLYEASMRSLEDVMNASKDVMTFCLKKGIDKRSAVMLSLFVEEMGTNGVFHGFKDVKDGSMDLRLICGDSLRVIRLRDNGRPFDPTEWLEKNHPANPESGLGIRVVTGLAKDVKYISAMELNNLTIQL